MTYLVGIADLKVATTSDDVLITYALGSCLGVAIYDPVVRVGGLLHAMLPQSDIDKTTARINPYMFVDTGVLHLFEECYKLGAKKERIILKAAGSASTNHNKTGDHLQIGQHNFLMLRKLLWENGVPLQAQNVGGDLQRTMSLNLANGQVILKIQNVASIL